MKRRPHKSDQNRIILFTPSAVSRETDQRGVKYAAYCTKVIVPEGTHDLRTGSHSHNQTLLHPRTKKAGGLELSDAKCNHEFMAGPYGQWPELEPGGTRWRKV